MTDKRFTRISSETFDAAYAAAEDKKVSDYRSCAGPLIEMAMTGGQVTHMRYIGGTDPGSFRCNCLTPTEPCETHRPTRFGGGPRCGSTL